MIEDLRKQIDTIDDELLQLLQKRVAVMKKVGEAKKSLQQPIRDEQREKEKLAEVEGKANLLQIPNELVINIWKLFFEISEEIEK
jgi:chorismate mutase